MRSSTFALILTVALLAWAVVLNPLRMRAADVGDVAINDGHRSLPDVVPPATTPHRVEQRGADVVLESYALNDATLSGLRRGDRIELPHPDGGTIELRVTRADSAEGRRHLLLVHDGLVSTFTEAHGLFFGTLATPRGVYALEGDSSGSRLTRHALLDQRMNTHAVDYRPSPAS